MPFRSRAGRTKGRREMHPKSNKCLNRFMGTVPYPDDLRHAQREWHRTYEALSALPPTAGPRHCGADSTCCRHGSPDTLTGQRSVARQPLA